MVLHRAAPGRAWHFRFLRRLYEPSAQGTRPFGRGSGTAG